MIPGGRLQSANTYVSPLSPIVALCTGLLQQPAAAAEDAQVQTPTVRRAPSRGGAPALSIIPAVSAIVYIKSMLVVRGRSSHV